MSRAICVVDSCGREAHARGLCNSHVYQQRVGKELGAIRPRYTKCEFPDCARPHYSKQYCEAHYMQLKATGALRPVNTKMVSPDRYAADRILIGDGDNPCWEWTGTHTPNGYGAWHATLGGAPRSRRSTLAHRVVWELYYGRTLSKRMTLDHLCRNRKCVSPLHVDLVSSRENVKRMHAFHCLQSEIEALRAENDVLRRQLLAARQSSAKAA